MIIENEKVRLEVVEHGGEIQSFYDQLSLPVILIKVV